MAESAVDLDLDGSQNERRTKRAAAARVAEVTREVSARQGWRKPAQAEMGGGSPKKTSLGPGVEPLKEGGGIFKSAAVAVLRQERRLMSTGEICRLALSRGLIRCQGKTPEATMASALYTDVKRKEAMSVFIRPLEGLFGLREWEDEGFVPPGPDGRPITDYQPLRTSRVRKPVLKRGRSGRDDSLTDTPKRRGGASKQEDARRGPGRPRKRAARDDDDPSYFAGTSGGARGSERVVRRSRRYEDFEYGDFDEDEDDDDVDFDGEAVEEDQDMEEVAHAGAKVAEEVTVGATPPGSEPRARGRGRGRGRGGARGGPRDRDREQGSHPEDGADGDGGVSAKSPDGILDTPKVLDLPLPTLGVDGETVVHEGSLGGGVLPLFGSSGVSPAIIRSPMRLFEGFTSKTPRAMPAGSPSDLENVLGMLYSPANGGRGLGGLDTNGRPGLSPLGRPSAGARDDGLVVVGVGAKRAVEAYLRASPRLDLLKGGIPVPGNTASVTAQQVPGADKDLIAMEEKTQMLERTSGPNSPRTGIALLFLARAYLHTGSVLGADKALFSLHKAVETMQAYARQQRVTPSAQTSKMFEYLRSAMLAAKGRAQRAEEAARAAAAAAGAANVGPSIAARRKSELEPHLGSVGPKEADGQEGAVEEAPASAGKEGKGGGSPEGAAPGVSVAAGAKGGRGVAGAGHGAAHAGGLANGALPNGILQVSK